MGDLVEKLTAGGPDGWPRVRAGYPSATNTYVDMCKRYVLRGTLSRLSNKNRHYLARTSKGTAYHAAQVRDHKAGPAVYYAPTIDGLRALKPLCAPHVQDQIEARIAAVLEARWVS